MISEKMAGAKAENSAFWMELEEQPQCSSQHC
jgi:hypothetical protein